MRPTDRAEVFESISSYEPVGNFRSEFESIAENNSKRNPYDEIEKIFCSNLRNDHKLIKILDIIINDILDSHDFNIPEVKQQIKYDLIELSKFDDGVISRYDYNFTLNPLILAFHIREDSRGVQYPEEVDVILKLKRLRDSSQVYFETNQHSEDEEVRKLANECKKISEILLKYSNLIAYIRD